MTQTQVERLFIKDRTSLVAQQFRLTTNLTVASATQADITANLEAMDNPTGFGALGAAITEGSGTFTFPVTGKYLITAVFYANRNNAASVYTGGRIRTTHDNSTYAIAAIGYGYIPDINGAYTNVVLQHVFDVTNTTTHKVRFMIECGAAVIYGGHSDQHRTHFTFQRLGDT